MLAAMAPQLCGSKFLGERKGPSYFKVLQAFFKHTLPQTNSSNLNRCHPKREVFQPSICRRYVSFRDCSHMIRKYHNTWLQIHLPTDIRREFLKKTFSCNTSSGLFKPHLSLEILEEKPKTLSAWGVRRSGLDGGAGWGRESVQSVWNGLFFSWSFLRSHFWRDSSWTILS